MRINLFVYLSFIVFLGCNFKRRALVEKWTKDSTGCLGYRTWNNLDAILKEMGTERIDSVKLTEILGKPQEIIQVGQEETISKYIVSERCFKGLVDTCFGVIILNNKKHSISSYDRICQ